MKGRSLAILLLIMAFLIPIYFIYRYLLRVMRPRESAARLFLFLISNLVLIVVYTLLVVGLIVKLFPVYLASNPTSESGT